MAQQRNYKKGNQFLVWLLIAIVSFTIGARYDDFMMAMQRGTSPSRIDTASLQQTYQILRDKYDGKIDAQALMYGANRGMVEALGDKYTVYSDPEETVEFEKAMSGDIGGGIGVEIGMRQGMPTILRFLKDSSAQQAGVQVNDAIVAVNGESTADWTLSKTVERVRGDVGTTVKLTLLRDGNQQEVSVTRRQVVAPSVEHSIDGEIGILSIRRFADDTGQLATVAAQDFKKHNVKKVILDLRGNGGGTVSSAQRVAGLWINHDVLLTERRGDAVVDTIRTTGEPLLNGMKTVVLIDGGSASASEIVAGALHDYKKATLVGEKSFGKGTVQAVVPLDGGAQLRVTQARWYTPQGVAIDKKGIQPDVEVKMTKEDFDAARDPQLDKAKEL